MIDWTKQPAITTEFDIFTYVREGDHWEASKQAAVKLFRKGGLSEEDIAELCKGLYFNRSAPNFLEECANLVTIALSPRRQERPQAVPRHQRRRSPSPRGRPIIRHGFFPPRPFGKSGWKTIRR